MLLHYSVWTGNTKFVRWYLPFFVSPENVDEITKAQFFYELFEDSDALSPFDIMIIISQ